MWAVVRRILLAIFPVPFPRLAAIPSWDGVSIAALEP